MKQAILIGHSPREYYFAKRLKRAGWNVISVATKECGTGKIADRSIVIDELSVTSVCEACSGLDADIAIAFQEDLIRSGMRAAFDGIDLQSLCSCAAIAKLDCDKRAAQKFVQREVPELSLNGIICSTADDILGAASELGTDRLFVRSVERVAGEDLVGLVEAGSLRQHGVQDGTYLVEPYASGNVSTYVVCCGINANEIFISSPIHSYPFLASHSQRKTGGMGAIAGKSVGPSSEVKLIVQALSSKYGSALCRSIFMIEMIETLEGEKFIELDSMLGDPEGIIFFESLTKGLSECLKGLISGGVKDTFKERRSVVRTISLAPNGYPNASVSDQLEINSARLEEHGFEILWGDAVSTSSGICTGLSRTAQLLSSAGREEELPSADVIRSVVDDRLAYRTDICLPNG